MRYSCELCGYVYDENVGDTRNGIVPGTAFDKLPSHFECPGCGYGKEAFDPVQVRQGNLLQTQSRSKMATRR